MMLERLKNYIKANTDVGEGIQLGGIDGNTEKYIGVYPGNRRLRSVCAWAGRTDPRRRVLCHGAGALGQEHAVRTGQSRCGIRFVLCPRGLRHGRLHRVRRGANGGPVPVGKDDRGVCEFVINLKMTYMKE